MKQRVVFGCGSQALYVLDNLLAAGEAPPKAFVDLEKQPERSSNFEGYQLLGLDAALDRSTPSDTLVIVAHGDNLRKLAIARRLENAGFQFFNAVNPAAMISRLSVLGTGCIVNAGATILPRARIGSHVIVHSGAVVEHDCVLDDGCNIAPGAALAGRVHVGSGAYLFTGCAIAPRLHIGANAVVGAGAVVLGSVPESTKVAGCPAGPI